MSGLLSRWRTIDGRPCSCGHDDLLHMALVGRCLKSTDGNLCDCAEFERAMRERGKA